MDTRTDNPMVLEVTIEKDHTAADAQGYYGLSEMGLPELLQLARLGVDIFGGDRPRA